MQNKWRLLSTRGLWRRHLTAEDVEAVYARCVDKLRQLIRERKGVLPERSARRAVVERLESLSDEALVEDLFSNAHPNPERIGCPSREMLLALARKERPIGDPAYDHLAECSPCYIELLAVQRAAGLRPNPAASGH